MSLQKSKLYKNQIQTINITDQIFSELTKLASIDDIEAGVVKYFLYQNKISSVENIIIKQLLLSDAGTSIFEYFKEKSVSLTILDIEKLFELLIPIKDVQLNGAVYTPPYIAEYIINNTIDHFGSVCDPACGSGAFLLRVLNRLKEFDKKSLIDIVENQVFGIDILDYAIRRAKILLSLFLLINGEDKADIRFNLTSCDSLKIVWKEKFPEVFKNGGFDFILSNPPYVRIQDLNNNYKVTLQAHWKVLGKGNFNLYFAFFELGINILKRGGKLGYITPNNYFTSLAGKNLRSYLNSSRAITKIVNFNHLKIFENAQTYTAITFLEKSYDKDYFEYYYIENRDELNRIDNIKFSKYYFSWLDNKKWRLMSEIDFNNIRKIESTGRQLGKLCDIRVGIATLKDNIFFVETYNQDYCKKIFKGKEYLIEKNLTKKVIKIPTIKDEKSIRTDKRRIIFPYIKKNNKYTLINEQYLKENFPNAYLYLLDAKPELENRDKGKKNYKVWYAWGRTQGMDYQGPRLYTKTFSHEPRFILDPALDNLFCNGYAIFVKEHIKAIQKILNSKIMQYYIKKTSFEIEGGYQCYQKNFIEKFGIQTFSAEEWEYLENEVNKSDIELYLIKIYKLDSLFQLLK